MNVLIYSIFSDDQDDQDDQEGNEDYEGENDDEMVEEDFEDDEVSKEWCIQVIFCRCFAVQNFSSLILIFLTNFFSSF